MIENINRFVLLHEIGHVCAETYGETEEFWETFKYILTLAHKYDLYYPLDYNKIYLAFHEMRVEDNPLFVDQIKPVNGRTEHFGSCTPMNIPTKYNKFLHNKEQMHVNYNINNALHQDKIYNNDQILHQFFRDTNQQFNTFDLIAPGVN